MRAGRRLAATGLDLTAANRRRAASRGPLAARLVSLAMLVAGCGPDQSFEISDVQGASFLEGPYDVVSAKYVPNGASPATVILLLGDADEPCDEVTATFCPRDSGKKLNVRPVVETEELPGVRCDGPTYVPRSIHGSFSDACTAPGFWKLVSADATVEIDDDEAHLVLHGTMAPRDTGIGTGTFDVDIDVVAETD